MAEIPPLITTAGTDIQESYLKFFTINIRNENTRATYRKAVNDFLSFCDERSISLFHIEPIIVSAYVEQKIGSAATINVALAAIKQFFSHLVRDNLLTTNPVSEVRRVARKRKPRRTSPLSSSQVHTLLNSIDTSTIIGLRDKALISVMLYTFARISALLSMEVRDFYKDKNGYTVRFYAKGDKAHHVPLHPIATKILLEYLKESGISKKKRTPLFRTFRGKSKTVSNNALQRTEVYLMIKRRITPLDMPEITCHSLRATGITNFLENGGSLKEAQAIAGHASIKTTEIYDRGKNCFSHSRFELMQF